jgi:Ca-activated chloride channel family protein
MPAILTAPAKPGDYEIRYFSDGNGTVLNRAPLKVSQAEVNIERPKEIPAGKKFEISWSGPDSQGDLIFVTEKDLDDNKYYTTDSKYIRTQDGASGQLIAPAKPGDYEIRYYSKNNGDVLARFPLKVGEPGVTLKAPRVASVGTKINVEWTGPNEEGDLIFICEPDIDESMYYYGSERSFNTSDKSPAILTVPAKPGTYEIRYYSKDNGDVLARRALIVR